MFFRTLAFFALTSSAQAGDVSQATQDAMLHVLAHEMGHAVLREFDLPILGSEEVIADDFATWFVFTMLPDRAEAIVSAIATQEMVSDEETSMFGEYMPSDQRAGRMVCLLYGQDPDRFGNMAERFGLEGDEAAACRDSSSEIARSWRRTMAPYWMPEGARVTEVSVRADDTQTALALVESDFGATAYELLSAVDWHSQVKLVVAECDGSAVWSRNGRRITICDQYVQRFEAVLGD